jgi:hypothetical protein
MLAELEQKIKANPPINGSYPINNMPFSEACMRETGRLYTKLIMIMRYPAQDATTPEGIIISKGWVAGSPIATQQDPHPYDQPEKWDPRRFLRCRTHHHPVMHRKFRNKNLFSLVWPANTLVLEEKSHMLCDERVYGPRAHRQLSRGSGGWDGRRRRVSTGWVSSQTIGRTRERLSVFGKLTSRLPRRLYACQI